MPYFLAVDAGGTKTDIALADETQELARVRTGSIQRQRVHEDAATQNLSDALKQLEFSSGVGMRLISRCCIGTSGDSVPLVAAWLRQAFSARVGGELLLLSDVEIALDSCFHGTRGVLVLAGTGSNVAGRAATGRIVTAGGWGPNLADQGSGQFIGLEALRRGFLALDEERETTLLDRAHAHWKLSSLNELIEFANSNPAPNFTTFAPIVVAAAEEGDLVAKEVLDKAGRDLADLAGLVIARIRKLESNATDAFLPPPIAVAGSILSKVAAVRAALTESLRSMSPGIQILDAPADPVLGALWRARKGA
jgi:N-acetylglucosamine kinase-like BadF-type ATPase